MRQARYLNVILTVNAALLGGLLWVQIAGSPLGGEAMAQDPPSGIPNSAKQRNEMIAAINRLHTTVESMNKSLTSAEFRVTVTNLDQINVGNDDG